MHLVWKVLLKTDPPGSGASLMDDGSLEEGAQREKRLTSANFAQLSGREEMTENRLRTGQNRYIMHRAYAGVVVAAM